MQLEARPWLPANAVRDPRLAEALGASAHTWSRRWFRETRQAGVRMSECRRVTTIDSEATCWGHPRGGLTLSLNPSAHTALGSAMLGADCAAHALSKRDHHFLRTLASACARDLLQEVAGLFGLDRSSEIVDAREAEAGFRYTINLGMASQLIDLFVEEDLAIGARRTLAGRVAPSTIAEGARQRGLDRQKISVGAMVGKGRLGLGELGALAVGDVLLLDRGPSDTLDLAIDGVARARSCQIVQEDAHLRLCLNQPSEPGEST